MRYGGHGKKLNASSKQLQFRVTNYNNHILAKHNSQIWLHVSAASPPTNKPQTKVIIGIVMIKLKLWLATDCEAKVVPELSTHPLYT